MAIGSGVLRAAPAASFGFLAKPLPVPVIRGLAPLPPVRTASVAPVFNARPALAIPSRVLRPTGAESLAAKIVLDSSLGQTGQPMIAGTSSAKDYLIVANLGKLAPGGGNLYFSFARFDLMMGETATFANSEGVTGVRNILARVTGGASSIDGLIKSEIEGANLFLMNSAGFVFGKNARLDLKGSFAVTTADCLHFADGSQFAAAAGNSDRVLTASPVSTFGFSAAKPHPVTFQGDAGIPTTLAVPKGSGFSVVAGEQTSVAATTLSAPAGRLSLVSVGGPGEVPASQEVLAETALSALPPLGSISLEDSAFIRAITIGAGGAGHIEIVAQALDVSGSFINASVFNVPFGAPASEASSIHLRCDNLRMSGSTIAADASAFGHGGNIDIRAHAVSLLSLDSSPSIIGSTASDHATSGHIKLSADTLNIVESTVKTSTFGAGAAGDIDVRAGELHIVGSARVVPSGILSEGGGSTDEPALGPGGSVHVVANRLELDGGGQISATTFGPAKGGDVSVVAQAIRISGFNVSDGVISPSGIFANSALPGEHGAGGDGGRVTVRAQSLGLFKGGQISTNSRGSGNGGDAVIVADDILLDGTGTSRPTGFLASTTFANGGQGGSLSIAAEALRLRGGAVINASTEGLGAGGNITIQAPTLDLSGHNTRIAAQTLGFAGGRGGAIDIEAVSVVVNEGAQISASTKGSGQGGSILIAAREVTVTGAGSSILADSAGFSGTVVSQPRVGEITLTLTIDHPSDADLNATLIAPEGSGRRTIELFNDGDLSGASLLGTTFSDAAPTSITLGVAPYAKTFRPGQPLDVLLGARANGTWGLVVGDSVAGNVGMLRAWSLTLNGTQIAASDVPVPINDFDAAISQIAVNLPLVRTVVKAGAGGDIKINAGNISVLNGGAVSASTLGSGAAGAVHVHADSVLIDASHGTSDTGFFATTAAGSTGRGGTITVTAKTFRATGSGDASLAAGVIARSATNALAGDISVESRKLDLEDGATITSANTGGGAAGGVKLTARDSIVLQGGSSVTALSQAADAGTISLSAGHRIELHAGSTITASAGANGGSIALAANDLVSLDRSAITATAGTSASTGGVGSGGNITIDPAFLIFDGSSISANAALGQGGNILLEADHFLSSATSLTANGRTAGTVEVISPELDLLAGLVGLPGSVLDASTQLRDQCARRLNLEFSSFLTLGRGGVESSPGEPLAETNADPAGELEKSPQKRNARQK